MVENISNKENIESQNPKEILDKQKINEAKAENINIHADTPEDRDGIKTPERPDESSLSAKDVLGQERFAKKGEISENGIIMSDIISKYLPNPNSRIDNLKMGEIYTLADTAKANIAYFNEMIKPITNEELKIIREKTNLIDVKKALKIINNPDEDYQLTPKIIKSLNAIKNSLYGLRQQKIVESFYRMYGPKQTPPLLMPIVVNLASGDGSGTAGLGGIRNCHRELFQYNEASEIIHNNNFFSFGPESKPMEIAFSANGADGNSQNIIHIAISDPKGNPIGAIGSEYHQNTDLAWQKDGDIGDISIKNNIISIPEKYRGYRIELMTQSGYAGTGSNFQMDEINITLSVINGVPHTEQPPLDEPPITETTPEDTPIQIAEKHEYSDKITNPMSPGAYKFEYRYNKNHTNEQKEEEIKRLEEVKNKINEITNDIVSKGEKTKETGIKLNINIGADQTLFTNASLSKDLMTTYKQDVSQKLRNILPTKFDAIMTNFSNIIPIDPIFKNGKDQFQAQSLLYECRFLSTLSQALENKTLASQIESGKYNLVGNPINSKERFISLQPEVISYIENK